MLFFAVSLFFIINLFLQDKTTARLWLAIAGFGALPILSTLFVRTLSKIQPISKVIIITGIWVTWVVLAGLAALGLYSYWDTFWPAANPGYCLDYCQTMTQGLKSL